MNQSHIVDSWIAELGLSGRRTRRAEEPVAAAVETKANAGWARPGPAAPPALAFELGARYRAVPCPC